MIRKATTEDLAAIREWLPMCSCLEETAVDGTFVDYPKNILDNWYEIIEQPSNTGKLLVYCIADQPVGFMTGGPDNEFHLVVNENFRNRGIGRKLVQYVLDRERENSETLWYFAVRPDSIPFWKKMGFNISYQTAKRKPLCRYPYAWRNIERVLHLPLRGVDVEVEILFRRAEKIENAHQKRVRKSAPPEKVVRSQGRLVFTREALAKPHGEAGRRRWKVYFPSQIQFNFGELLSIVRPPDYNWDSQREVRVKVIVRGVSLFHEISYKLTKRDCGKTVYAGYRLDTLQLGPPELRRIFRAAKKPHAFVRDRK